MFSTFRLINFYSNVRCLQNFESEVIEDKERVLCDFSKWQIVHFGITQLNGDQSSGHTKHLREMRSK